MKKRHGISRADMIVVSVICMVGLSILFPVLVQRRAEVRRVTILQNPQRASTEAELAMVGRLAETVIVLAPSTPGPGLYTASIPVPEDLRVTGGMVQQALHLGIFFWSSKHHLWLMGRTIEYEIGPSAQNLTARFLTQKESN